VAVLHHKLAREVLRSAGTLLTVVGIIAVGTGCFIGLGSAVRILSRSQTAYYQDYRFADFWIHVKKAPLTAVERIAELPGVADVEGRVVFDVILDVPGVIQPLTGRLLSTPARGFADTINGVHIVRGTGFSHDRDEEVLLSEAFAARHDLGPGDRISLILNRKQESFVIVGTAISPEYVYMVRGVGDLVPDPEHFGILYVQERYAREVLDFQDAANEIVGRVVPGPEADVEILLERMTRRLEPFGVLDTTPRARQASHRVLTDEIEGGRVTATVAPVIFLAVAALVLNILMSRLAERQRTIIGTLKAMGYTNHEVLRHYVSFGVIVGAVGGLAGIGVGIWLASSMVEFYRDFFQFPRFVYELYYDLFGLGMLISVSFAVAGTARGVWRVLRLQPADAMRVKPPERGGAILLERWPGLWNRLGFRTHVALRTLMRNRIRTATGVAATALATAMMLMSLSMSDGLWYLVDYQFEKVSHSDVDIGLRDERSRRARYEVQQLPGVDYAEPVLGLVCDIRHGRRARRMAISGLDPGHRLTTPRRADGGPIVIPPDGFVLSAKLAQILDARVGDRLTVQPARGRREAHEVRVASIVDTFLGLECYADIRYLGNLVGETVALNSVQTTVDPSRRDALFRAVKKLPNAQGLSVRQDRRANIEGTLVKSMGATMGVLIVFAGMLAFGSLLNNALVEISDQIRDIATFRVLGYRPREIAAIFFRQSMLVFAVGLTLAIPLGYGFNAAIVRAYDTELYRLPVVFKPLSVLGAALAAGAFVLLAQLVVYRQIRRLDWLEGVKVKE
jgi:putative ABC transport system permease protein